MPALEKAANLPYAVKYFDTNRREFLYIVGQEKI
jgi:hypothetical protein